MRLSSLGVAILLTGSLGLIFNLDQVVAFQKTFRQSSPNRTGQQQDTQSKPDDLQPAPDNLQQEDPEEKAGAENADADLGKPKFWARPIDVDKVKLARAEKIKLPGAIKKELDRIALPALMSENHNEFFLSFQRILEKADVETLDRVEEYAELLTGKSIRSNYVDLKLRAIEQGIPHELAGKRSGAILLLVRELAERVQDQLEELNAHALMQDPLALPESWKERDAMFWDAHVFENRMLNALKLSRYGYSRAAEFVKRANHKKQAEEIKRVKVIETLPFEVECFQKALMEREAELRIEDLRDAVATLKNEQDFEQRLHAAFALQTDEENLSDFFRNRQPGSFDRAKLNAPNITAEITKLVNEGREAGKDVIEKAMLLRMGAHWWLRGRYGAGPMARGLLKGPNAVNSHDEMFGLYMPAKRPQAIGTYSKEEGYAPGYDRRHYYTWYVGNPDSSFQKRSDQVESSTKINSVSTTDVSQNQAFW